MVKEKSQEITQTAEELSSGHVLILYNDDENTFDFIIDTLIEVVGHSAEQAEQCALIAHYRGKCSIKKGSLSELKPIYTEMLNRKIIVEIK